MRLALRFAVAITIGIGAVLAMQAVLHVQRIGKLQEAEIRENLITLGRALAPAVGEVWTIGGAERAEAFVAKADVRRDRTKITLHRLDEREDTTEVPEETRIQRLSTDEGWSIVAEAPVRSGGRVVAELEIERELPSEQEYFASILWTQVGTTIIAAGISGLIAAAVGVWIIGRPIRRLTDLARRVTLGDYSLRSNIVQLDEIGNLARELDAMTARLEENEAQIRAERHARTQTLEKLRHADRLSTVGRLASSIAHELGTPLNIVSGRAMMIAADEETPEETRENAEHIAEQAARMTSIIREILDFSGRKPVEKREISIGRVVEHSVSLLAPILDDRGIDVRVGGEKSWVAPIDEGKILQVLTNLMMNAIQAMPEGGSITLDVDREHVMDPKDRHAAEGVFVIISVADEGVGIPEERLASIFEAFSTSKDHGTGLGLSVCHGIVREHGGWIDVESEVGRGSRFKVYLPEGEDA